MWSDPLVVSVLEMVVGCCRPIAGHAKICQRPGQEIFLRPPWSISAWWRHLVPAGTCGFPAWWLLWGPCSAMFSLAEFTKDVHSTPGWVLVVSVAWLCARMRAPRMEMSLPWWWCYIWKWGIYRPKMASLIRNKCGHMQWFTSRIGPSLILTHVVPVTKDGTTWSLQPAQVNYAGLNLPLPSFTV